MIYSIAKHCPNYLSVAISNIFGYRRIGGYVSKVALVAFLSQENFTNPSCLSIFLGF